MASQIPAAESGSWHMEHNLTGGEEPEVVREVERYQLDIVGLPSIHSIGSGTKLLNNKRWSLSYSGVAQGERLWVGVGIITSPWLAATQLEFFPVDNRVASMGLKVAGRKALAVVCTYTPDSLRHSHGQ